MTLDDWKIAGGIRPGAADLAERVVDGLQLFWAPVTIDGLRGYWWGIGTLDGRFLAGAWSAGNKHHLAMDVARKMLDVRRPRTAVA